MKPFFIYILKCRDNSYYIGHTDDLEKRISDQIYNDLKEYECEGFAQGFPKVQANLIAEYLV